MAATDIAELRHFYTIEGWRVNHNRVERIWREEGLKVPKKQPKRRSLWLNDGSCVRLRSNRRNHVWSYDFVADRTSDGRPIRTLTADDHRRVHSGVPRDRRRQEAHERRCARATPATCSSARVFRIISAASTPRFPLWEWCHLGGQIKSAWNHFKIGGRVCKLPREENTK